MTLTRRELVHTLGAAAGLGWMPQSPPGGAASGAPDTALDRAVHMSRFTFPLA